MRDRDSGQSRGFGFVEMSDAVGAQRAITEMNGAALDGRSINVSEAKPREVVTTRQGRSVRRR